MSGIYSTGGEVVESVFFAVVPDDFINRDRGGLVSLRRYAHVGDWADVSETSPLVPHDRWSF